MTPKRLHKIAGVVSKRQKYLTIVLENIHDPHNVSAILRSADATGIDKVFLIYNTNKFPKIGRISSGSAKKWIELVRFSNAADCFKELKKHKYRIYSSHIGEKKRTDLCMNSILQKEPLLFLETNTRVFQKRHWILAIRLLQFRCMAWFSR